MNNLIVKSKQSRGFTFMEILIILSIMTGLLVLVMSQAGTATRSSKISDTADIVKLFISAAHQYRNRKNSYDGISVQTLINLGLLPSSIYNCNPDCDDPNVKYQTVTPFHVGDGNSVNSQSAHGGITIWPANNGKDFWISLDFSVSRDTKEVSAQLHDIFGGLESRKAFAGGRGIHETGNEPNLIRVHKGNVDYDNQFWARQF